MACMPLAAACIEISRRFNIDTKPLWMHDTTSSSEHYFSGVQIIPLMFAAFASSL